ncbi:WD repeat-containing protein 87 [Geranomyces michiganensis]|nr:WD repeat-containing protein 87 [Geranomyces michiganensis]
MSRLSFRDLDDGSEPKLEPQKSDVDHIRDLSELGVSTQSLASDASDNPGSSPPSSDYVLLPWHNIKKKVQARAAATGSSGGAVLPTTMPHGFQLSRWLYHHRPTVRSAIYIPGIPDRIASVDSHNVNVWKNETKVSSIPLAPPPKTPKSPLAGLSRWLFVPTLKALFVATAQLELKLINTSFEQVAVVSSPKPVLSLEYLEAFSELITGGVGNIRVWRIKKSGDLAAPFHFDGCRLTIEDLQDEDWVSHTVYSSQNDCLYAGVGNMIYVYDYRTGERLETMREVHELSITAMVIFEPFGFLITASRDCTIKIFNRQNNLIQRLHEHTHAVTGLCLVPLPENKTGRSMAALAATPFFLSCSLDGTVRMWNADLGVCVYSLQTPSECLGIQWMKGDTFLHYAKDRISVWNLNRFYTSFTYTRSPVTQLSRVQVRNRPARILAVAEDASLRIVNPVTGIVLTIGFPVMEDMTPVASVYDLPRNRAWLLLNNGDLALYNTGTNPCEIVKEVRNNPGHARICCMASLSPRGVQDVLADRFTRSGNSTVFGLWAGCDAGQITLVDVRDPTRQQSVVQAHAGEITAIAYDANTMRLFSSGKDCVVKTWAVQVPLESSLAQLLDCPQDGDLKAEEAYADALDMWASDTTSATLRLTLISSVTIPDGFVTHIGWGATTGTLTCATDTKRILTVTIAGSAALKTHARDDEHTRTVTSLACSKATGIVASGSLDGTVKIWDGTENVLLREIQFAYPVTAVEFANPRGDLLVALSEELVTVRIQDYLPGPQLRTLLNAGPWVDDIVEDAATFDSGLDFWGLYRDAEESETTPWHVHKPQSALIQQQILASKAKGSLWGDAASLAEEEDEDGEVAGAHRSGPRVRRGGIFGDISAESDETSEAFDNGPEPPRPQSAPSSQERPDSGARSQVTHESVKTPTSMSRQLITRRLSKEDATPKSREMGSVTSRSTTQKELIKEVKNIKHAKKKHKKGGSKDVEIGPTAVSAEPASQEEAADRQAAIRRGMERLGILPNSMVAGQTTSVLMLKKAAEAQQRKEKDKIMLDNARAMVQRRRAERVARGEPISKFDALAEEDEEADDSTIQAQAQRAADGKRLRREVSEREARYKGKEPPESALPPEPSPINGPRQPVAAISEPLPTTALSSTEVPVTLTNSAVTEAETVAPGVTKRAPPPDLLPESRKALARKRFNYGDINVQGVLTVIMPDNTGLVHTDYSGYQSAIPVHIIPVRGSRPSPPSKAPAAAAISSASTHDLSISEIDEDVCEESLTRVVFERRTAGDRGASRASFSNLGRATDHRRMSSPGAALGSSHLEPGSVTQSFRDVRASYHSLGHGSRVKLMSEPAIGPEITHEVVMERILPELQGILSAFWFPGMGVLKTGYWSEKAEASDALLMLYHKFKDEFRDPLQDFIIPQLESLSDRDWQTRLRLCQNLVQYGVYAAPLIQALMARLLDENADVRYDCHDAAIEHVADAN